MGPSKRKKPQSISDNNNVISVDIRPVHGRTHPLLDKHYNDYCWKLQALFTDAAKGVSYGDG